jgi:DNA-binding transcriptional regulator YhcF (GntR family)
VPIDPYNARAVYRQIADDLRRQIDNGEWGPGHKIPSERDLQNAYRVSRVTSRRAVEVLVAEGLVTPVHGSGVFVAEPPAATSAFWKEWADRFYKLMLPHATCPRHPVDHNPDCPDCQKRSLERAALTEYRNARRRTGGWGT